MIITLNPDKTIDYPLLSRFVSTTNGRFFRGVDAFLFRKLQMKKGMAYNEKKLFRPQ